MQNVSSNNKLLSIFVIISVFLALGATAILHRAHGDNGGRKIVVFKSNVRDSEKEAAFRAHGAVKVKDLRLVNGAVVLGSDKDLKNDPRVLRVDDDVIVEALPIKEERAEEKGRGSNLSSTQPAQVLPWGVDMIDAEKVWPSGNTADPVKVGVIDTGISASHPDLQANIKGGVNTINPFKSWDDDNGHGSHVSGIIGAINNSIGVVGVGPAVDLYAIKALDRNGSGYLSDIIEGLQWAADHGIRVVNMSLGTTADIQSFHDAITAAYNAGVVVVAAAGNSGGSVIFPAAYQETIAVSAVDSTGNIAYFSSRGPEVDLAAPGVSVYSTYKGTGYATLSGTSMATPHVTGAAALVLNTPVGSYDANNNGKWDPAEVAKKLENRAVDKGAAGFDNLYGWGLVNAYQATQP